MNDSDLAFLQDTFREYQLESDTDQWIERKFCQVCRTTVTFKFGPGLPGKFGGTFDQPTSWHDLETFILASSKPDWLTSPGGPEVHDTAPYHPVDR